MSLPNVFYLAYNLNALLFLYFMSRPKFLKIRIDRFFRLEPLICRSDSRTYIENSRTPSRSSALFNTSFTHTRNEKYSRLYVVKLSKIFACFVCFGWWLTKIRAVDYQICQVSSIDNQISDCNRPPIVDGDSSLLYFLFELARQMHIRQQWHSQKGQFIERHSNDLSKPIHILFESRPLFNGTPFIISSIPELDIVLHSSRCRADDECI